jgi:hypothetical protein
MHEKVSQKRLKNIYSNENGKRKLYQGYGSSQEIKT